MEFNDLDKLLYFLPKEINKIIYEYYYPLCKDCDNMTYLCKECNLFYCNQSHNGGFFYCPICCSCSCGYKMHYLRLSGKTEELCYGCYILHYKNAEKYKTD